MAEPFLILHRVRGEHAFDIAEKFCNAWCHPCQPKCGLWNGETCAAQEENWWIIPTSGHRAYPYHMWPLLEMAFEQNVLNGGGSLKIGQLDEYTLRPPKDWLDHYACNDRPIASTAEHKSFAKGLLEKLGLVKPMRVERRF